MRWRCSSMSLIILRVPTRGWRLVLSVFLMMVPLSSMTLLRRTLPLITIARTRRPQVWRDGVDPFEISGETQ